MIFQVPQFCNDFRAKPKATCTYCVKFGQDYASTTPKGNWSTVARMVISVMLSVMLPMVAVLGGMGYLSNAVLGWSFIALSGIVFARFVVHLVTHHEQIFLKTRKKEIFLKIVTTLAVLALGALAITHLLSASTVGWIGLGVLAISSMTHAIPLLISFIREFDAAWEHWRDRPADARNAPHQQV